MIFSKDVSFPYPVYNNGSSAFIESEFALIIQDIIRKDDSLKIKYQYRLNSSFFIDLIKEQKASIYMIIFDYDSKYILLDKEVDIIEIPSSRLSLNDRMQIQLHLVSNQEINYSNCLDTTGIYFNIKNSIKVEKNALLGFSEVVTYDGPDKEGINLFKHQYIPEMDVPFEIDIENGEVITIRVKDKKYLLEKRKNLINMYLYIGLDKALKQFYHKQFDPGYDENIINIDNIDKDDLSILDYKIYSLLLSKNVKEIYEGNINWIVNEISDSMFDKYVDSIYELMEGNL